MKKGDRVFVQFYNQHGTIIDTGAIISYVKLDDKGPIVSIATTLLSDPKDYVRKEPNA